MNNTIEIPEHFPGFKALMSRFFEKNDFSQEDRDTLLKISYRLVKYYQIDEHLRHKAQEQIPTYRAKNEAYNNISLTDDARYNTGRLIDALARRAAAQKFKFPVCAKGFLRVKINENYLFPS